MGINNPQDNIHYLFSNILVENSSRWKRFGTNHFVLFFYLDMVQYIRCHIDFVLCFDHYKSKSIPFIKLYWGGDRYLIGIDLEEVANRTK